MKIEENTIIFKSTPENYFNEFHGFKCNTVRRMANVDELIAFLDFKRQMNVGSKVRITTEFYSGDIASFERYITDITKFEDLFIISWRPDS